MNTTKGNITKEDLTFYVNLKNVENEIVCTLSKNNPNHEDNADLILQAFNVYNGCGLSPIDLYKENIELTASVVKLTEELVRCVPNIKISEQKSLYFALHESLELLKRINKK